MDQSQIQNIILFIILLIFSGIFSCSETVFLSCSKIRMRTLSQEGNKNAKRVEHLLEDSDRLFSSILVGNNIVNMGASSITTSLIISVLGDGATTVAYATGIVTFLVLIFGEITPKTFATRNADKLALSLSKMVQCVVILFTPIVFLLNIITKSIIKLFGNDENNGPTMTEEELKTIVTVGHEEGVLEEEEKEMIHNVFEFGDREIREIMTPRIHVDSISDEATYEELMSLYQEGQYSRYPVHSESFDEIIGVLNIKDLLFFHIDESHFDIKDYMREVFVVYEFNKVSSVFASMRKEHATLAIVLDEYGVMSGIVTFEDIVEEIVGEIDDEYDDISEEEIKQIASDTYLVDGSLNYNDVNEKLDTKFDSEDFESIGGLVLGKLGSTPEVGQQIKMDNIVFEITKVNKNRIEQLKLKIEKIEDEKEEE